MNRSDQDYLWLTQSRGHRPLAYWLLLASFLPVMLGSVAFVLHSWFGSTATANIPLAQGAEVRPSPTSSQVSLRQRVEALQEKARQDSQPVSDGPVALEETGAGADWNEMPIESGDTLSIAFERHGLNYSDSLAMIRLPEYGWRFTRGLRAGTTLRFQSDAQGHLTALDYPLDKLRTIEVRENNGTYSAELTELEVDRRIAYQAAEIRGSFYGTGLQAGLSDNVIMNLARIFAWDIDFALDIQPGDRFAVVYEELIRDGEKVKDGDILAAEFVNRGRRYQAVRFDGGDGDANYYAPDGKALKKAFIRTPLNQFRISSHFNPGRRHPILNRIRRHSGTDYAAPTGTPIKATGDGKVIFRGRKGGYGNLVEIRHNKSITTRYGHMSRFAKGINTGSRVRQGQVIGYVGKTGLATGPHLHYEFREHGQPKNPETVRLPGAPPLSADLRPAFDKLSGDLLGRIEGLSRLQLAYAAPESEPSE